MKAQGSLFVQSLPNGGARMRVRHPLLLKDVHATFDDAREANRIGADMLRKLRAGEVPVFEGKSERATSLAVAIGEYLRKAPVAPTEVPELEWMRAQDFAAVDLSAIDAKWADGFVTYLKIERHNSPSTVRKRVQSLARVIDWRNRRDNSARANPLRTLPKGYSAANAHEANELKKRGLSARVDKERSNRLTPAECELIERALAGERRPGRERPLSVDPDFHCLYTVIVNLGLRLFEAYRMRVEDIDWRTGILRVRGSKGHRGKERWREVPLLPEVVTALRDATKGRSAGLVFPWWDGEEATRPAVSARLSMRFKALFNYIGSPHLTEHDLRHEAACRWVTRKNSKGAWMFPETAIISLMGWSGRAAVSMLHRYTSLRGVDFAAMMAA